MGFLMKMHIVIECISIERGGEKLRGMMSFVKLMLKLMLKLKLK